MPAPPKPETAEVVSTPQKTYPEMAPAAPAAPSPASSQPPPPEPEPQAAPKPRTATAQDPIATGDVLLNPSVPEDAKAIQSRLAELGFYKMAIDGIWERGSRAALRAFKEKSGLKNPKKWDKETQILLFRDLGK